MFTGANIVNGSLTGLDNGSRLIVRAVEAGPVAAPGTSQLEGHVVCAAVAA